MHSCNLLKKIILCIIYFYSLRLVAYEGSLNAANRYSDSIPSFKERFRQDSVLSFSSRKGYFPTLLRNLGYQASFPLRMKEKHFFMLGGCTILTLSLIQYDQQLDNHFRHIKDKNPFINSVSPHFTELGDYYGYILLAGYGGYSLAFHKYRAFRIAMLASQAAITAGVWIRVSKILSGRMRPGQTYLDPDYPSGHWFGPFAVFKKKYNKDRGVGAFDGFPSGHSGAAFAMATVISEEYKEYKAIPVVMYSIAGLVAVTRLIENEHWTSDIFIGSLIGYLCGKQVVGEEHRLFPDTKTSQKKVKSYFFPFNYSGINGLEWRLVF